jgi:hypothetical protein
VVPFGGVRPRLAAIPASPPESPPLVEVRCASECCMRPATGLFGSSDPAVTSSFPTRLRGVRWVAVPRKLALAGSSSRTLHASFRVSRAVPARRRPRAETRILRRAPPLGFPSPSRHQPAASTHASVPGSLRSVLDVSHVLDGLLRHQPCGFVSPHCHVRDSLFRGFPSDAAVRARRPPFPS